jgi:hypothetical protein
VGLVYWVWGVFGFGLVNLVSEFGELLGGGG